MIDTSDKRQACLSTGRIWCFQGPLLTGTDLSSGADREQMCFCYPFVAAPAPIRIGITGIKWLGDKTHLADRKANRLKKQGKLTKQQAGYNPEEMTEAELHMIYSGAAWVAYRSGQP